MDMIDEKSALQNVGELDRRSYIGGSRVSAILGLDAYGKTPLSEYQFILGEIDNTPDAETLAFFEWRKEWEPIVIKRVKREFDAKIVAVNQRYRDSEYDFLAAEIDAEWADEDGAIQNLEIKTVHPLAFSETSGWGEAGTSDVPIQYAAQCMWGLGITGRQVCILVAMAGIDTLVFYRIERDEEVIADMRERCIAFWTEYVLKRVPPEPINLDDVMRLTLKMRGRPVEADDEMVKNLQDLASIRASIAAFDGSKDDVMFKIGVAILKQWGIPAPAVTDKGKIEPAQVADNAVILRAGQQIASWKLQNTTRIDADKLRELHPDIAAACSKTTPSRVLRIKKPK